MAWSGGTYTKGNNGTGGWVGDASLGIGIEAGRHDTQDNDFATGINQCLNKDGSNSCTGDLNLGGFKPVNVAAGTAAAPAICAGGDVNTGIFSAAADQIGIATNGTERVRIDSTGRVGIGTTAPNVLMEVSRSANDTLTRFRLVNANSGSSADTRIDIGNDTNAAAVNFILQSSTNTAGPGANSFQINNGLSAPISFGTGGTERMRIDSAGFVGIGTTSSTDTRLLINGNATATHYPLVCRNGSSVVCFWVRNDGFINTGLNTNSPFNNTTGAAANLHVAGDGILYRSTSSLKYKTDIADYSNGLAAVNALRPVFYKDKKNPAQQFAGLIAEEVHEAGLHEFVSYNADNEPDALHYGNMVALAFKAIQELNAKVEALEARVAELEA